MRDHGVGVQAAVLAVLVGAALWFTADGARAGTIESTGTSQYEPTTGTPEESILTNEVTFSFSPDGGPFTAATTLVLEHVFPDRGCTFESRHVFTIEGVFDPASLQFEGTFQKQEGATTGECEGVVFSRSFGDDTGAWSAALDPVDGVIAARTFAQPLDLLIDVDPALVAALVPEEEPEVEVAPDATTTTTTTDTTDTTGATTTPAASEGGFPAWAIALLATLGVGGGVVLTRRRRATTADEIAVTSEAPLLDERQINMGYDTAGLADQIPSGRDPWGPLGRPGSGGDGGDTAGLADQIPSARDPWELLEQPGPEGDGPTADTTDSSEAVDGGHEPPTGPSTDPTG